MAEERHLVRIWDNLAFAGLFRSLKMALSPVRLVISLCAIVLICLIGWTMDAALMGEVRLPGQGSAAGVESVGDFSSSADLRGYLMNPGETLRLLEETRLNRKGQGVFAMLWHFGSSRFNGATVSLFRLEVTNVLMNIWLVGLGLVWAVKYHPVYSLVYFIIISVIISICGGAICRTAALEFARGEKPGLGEAMRFGLRRFRHLITTPLVLTMLTLMFGLGVFVIGLLGNIRYVGELIIALGMGVALVCGLLTLVFLIGAVAGANLTFPVIAYEGSDGYDAISRSFCYVYRRPWWLFCYTVIAAAYGTVSYLVVRLFTYLLLAMTWLLLDLGIFGGGEGPGKLARIWGKPDFYELLRPSAGPEGLTESAAAFIVYMTVLLVIGVIAAFVMSFYFCAGTIVYALMRRKVDGVDMSEIYIPLEAAGAGGSRAGDNGD